MPTQRRLVESGPDFYATPPWAVALLLDHEPLEGSIWEPACGDGAISKVLEARCADVTSSDLHDHGYGVSGQDFLAVTATDSVDNVITNPPSILAEDFFRVGYQVARRKLCLLLRTVFLESVRRYHTIFQPTPPARVWVFTKRLSMYPRGYAVKNPGTTSYAWFVWDKAHRGATVVQWLPPGSKPRVS